MNTFDELFNEFFDRNNKKPKKARRGRKPKNSVDLTGLVDLKSSIEELIKSISNIKPITDIDEQFEIDNNFGEPNSIEFYEEDGLFVKKSTWIQEGSEIVKLEVSGEPFNFEKEKSLEELLIEAVDNEDYEKAAEIRDKINGKKLKKYRKKKPNND